MIIMEERVVRGETRSGVLNRYLASLTRRALLKALASMPVVLGGVLPAWAAKTAPRARLISSKVCVVMPETTEGPFYVDPDLVRADITEGKAGVPVELLLQVVTADCEPVKDARVDVWHCDAEGNYSGFGASGSGSKAFLRGTQFTDSEGIARFETIYPGWYPGRVTHIHYKVFLGERTVLTSQLFFPDEINERVYAGSAPYNARPASAATNASDWIARRAGEGAVASLREKEKRYTASLVVGIDSARA